MTYTQTEQLAELYKEAGIIQTGAQLVGDEIEFVATVFPKGDGIFGTIEQMEVKLFASIDTKGTIFSNKDGYTRFKTANYEEAILFIPVFKHFANS